MPQIGRRYGQLYAETSVDRNEAAEHDTKQRHSIYPEGSDPTDCEVSIPENMIHFILEPSTKRPN